MAMPGSRLTGKSYSPSQISAFTLQKMKETAEAHLGAEVTQAVITVPAYSTTPQRQATKDAGKTPALRSCGIINEPTAAALAYGLDKKGSGTIAVYDLGGGTFDVSILEIGDGVFEVKSTNGDTFLGGEDSTCASSNISRRVQEGAGHRPAQGQARPAAPQGSGGKKAKDRALLDSQTEVNLPYITADASGPKHMTIEAPRAKFESLVEDLVKRTIDPCQKALKDCRHFGKPRSTRVVLVGGMTRMPKIQEVVKSFFGKEPPQGREP